MPSALSARARAASHQETRRLLLRLLVRVTCPCGTSRHVDPEALARIAGRSVMLAKLSTRMRCSNCGKKIAEVVAVARPKPRSGGRRR
jgi:hypothetical protein